MLDPETMAAQLRCPGGEHAAAVAEFMNRNNLTLFRQCLHRIPEKNGLNLLEIGPGDGTFIAELYRKIPNLHYTALDYSPEMVKSIEEKIKQNQWHNARVMQGNSLTLNLFEKSQDAVLAVNLIYFWPDLQNQFNIFKKVLKKESVLVLGFRSAAGMSKLPFTKFGFLLRERSEIIDELKKCGFGLVNTDHYEEKIKSLDGVESVLENIVLTASF